MKKALIIGFNNYPNARLNGCINDALKISNVLKKNGDGSPNFAIKLMTDETCAITKAQVRQAIESLFDGPNDTCLLYFSGHGLIKSTGGYIVTPDYERYDEGISMDEILCIANKSKARDKVIILDCCHSGAFGSPSLTDSNVSQIAEGVTILTASRSEQSALERNGSGVFTSLLIDALQGGASDLRGQITPGGIYSYIDEALGAWDQRPIFKTNISKFTKLRSVKPPIPLDILRRITEYFKSPHEEYKLNPTYEDTEECCVQENVAIFKDLQKYQSVGLVVPVDAEFMYFAAIESKSCRLTALGYQYWRLVKENNL